MRRVEYELDSIELVIHIALHSAVSKKKKCKIYARFNGRQDLPYSGMKTVPLINVYTLSR